MLHTIKHWLLWTFDLVMEVIADDAKHIIHELSHRGVFLIIVILGIVYLVFPEQVRAALSFVFIQGWPFVLPVVLGYILWYVWFWYKTSDYIDQNFLDRVTLEVKLPFQVMKTPQAMEIALRPMYEQPTITWWDRFVNGRQRPWFSLEMASIDGEVHFFVNCMRGYRQYIETGLYGQYPGIEIYEVEDYTKAIPKGTLGSHVNPKADWLLWCVEPGMTKPDPYPIKTYVDYGLDKAAYDVPETSEMTRIKVADPIASVVESFGRVTAGEQMWLQIVIRAGEKRFPKKGGGLWPWILPDFARQGWYKDTWREPANNLVSELKEKSAGEHLSHLELDTMGVVSRSLNKWGYDCFIRGIYMAPREKFKHINIVAIKTLLRVYNSENYNGFKTARATTFDFPWQDLWGLRANHGAHSAVKAYRMRSGFFSPHTGVLPTKIFTLNSEELATIYHFPGNIAETPTLSRIKTTKAEPPPNLPQ